MSASASSIPISMSGDSQSELAASYAACAETTRRTGRNFYYGLRLTPEPRRAALYAIYAWMRAADDAADERAPIETRRAKLVAFRERTERVLEGGTTGGNGELWPAFQDTAHRYNLDHGLFWSMLGGLEDDLQRPEREPAFADEEALDAYCYQVGSTVGLVCVSIWGTVPGADADAVRVSAIRLGTAYQRTNILRDIVEDLADGRVYLPADAFERYGVTPAQLAGWSDRDACTALISEQASIARERYSAHGELIGSVCEDCRPVLGAMTQIYSGILRRIERRPGRITRGRVRLGRLAKLLIALRASRGAHAVG
ncbi:MAG: phytoene/squalene synthase family protein [Planctomycetota bacterium]